MALRVPGADTPERLWQHILEGRDLITRADTDTLRTEGTSWKELSNPSLVAATPKLYAPEYADTALFDISDFEASLMDPGQKLFLECVWEALERASIPPGKDPMRIGVYAGSEGDYREINLRTIEENDTSHTLGIPVRIGNYVDFLPARASYKLGLQGPSFSVLAACATSLVATHLAVQSLRRGECDLAIAGGATILCTRKSNYLAGVEGMLSSQGRVRPFDAEADGTVFGDGAGVILLRKLSDAVEAGNPVHAVIQGSAVTNDGHPDEKESFVAPSRTGQIAAISAALEDAGITPDTIDYVEAHGTATLLGDPLEVDSLTEVYRRHSDVNGYCGLGSVKGNVGHLRTAAGVVSLIKMCLALQHRTLPPTGNHKTPNPRLDIDNSPFYINTAPRKWQSGDSPRRAAISSFGFGGSNAHLVLEEYCPVASSTCSNEPEMFIFSALSPQALRRQHLDLAKRMSTSPAPSIHDVAFTLQAGRTPLRYRACYYVDPDTYTPEKFFQSMPDVAGHAAGDERNIVFLFPGQGSQRPGMGTGLYAREPVYREIVDYCAQTLEPELGFDLRRLIDIPVNATQDAVSNALSQTAHAQPALFVVEYAMALLFQSRGVFPSVMIGHSVGELVAACLAGVFSLENGLRIVAARSRLMQNCPPGSMAAIFLPATEVTGILPENIELGAINSPMLSVVSGPNDAVRKFCIDLESRGIGHRPLATSHAFHSWMMDDALPGFREVLAGIKLAPPSQAFVSNLTGELVTNEQAIDPAYWADHIRHTVHFSKGLETVLKNDNPVFLEIGPGSTLSEIVKSQAPHASCVSALPAHSVDEVRSIHMALASTWAEGARIEWNSYKRPVTTQGVTLPTYPFQRVRNYIEPGDTDSSPSFPLHLYEQGWAEAELDTTARAEGTHSWIVFNDKFGVGDTLTDRLREEGESIFELRQGDEFRDLGEGRFLVRPGRKHDVAQVLRNINAGVSGKSLRVVHMWLVTSSAGEHNSVDGFIESTRLGYQAVTSFLQAAYEGGFCDDLKLFLVADAWTALDGETGEIHSEKGGITGMVRAIPTEFPGIKTRGIDIPELEPRSVPAWLHDRLHQEVLSDAATTLVALREASRFGSALYPVSDLLLNRCVLRDGGVVLITGGLGGLGLQLAKVLFEACGARIALNARRSLPERSEWDNAAEIDDTIGFAVRGIRELEKAGAEVMIVYGDVSEYANVSAIIDEVEANWGAIHGVVHCAGIASPILIMDAQPEEQDPAFRAKVHGAYHLEKRLEATPLDFFIHAGSQASYGPWVGQYTYAIANSAVDSLARRRATKFNGMSCAIGWGPWEEIGMAANAAIWNPKRANRDRADATIIGKDDIDLPFFHTVRHIDNGATVYRANFPQTGERDINWVLEHQLDGQPLLAGVTIMECVRSVYDHFREGDGPMEISNVAFLRPLFINERGSEVEVMLSPRDHAEVAFTVRSRAKGRRSSWIINSEGRCKTDLGTVSDTFPPPIGDLRDSPFLATEHKHITAGERWHCITGNLQLNGIAWSRLELAEKFHGDVEHFVLHPALFDMAIGRFHHGFEPAGELPFGIGSLKIYGAMPPKVYLRGQHRLVGETPVFHIQLVDGSGRLLVDMTDFVTRDIEDSALLDTAAIDQRTSFDKPVTNHAYRATVARPGDLESVELLEFPIPEPGPDEVVIESVAASLNFRDVLTALDQMPDAPASEPPVGIECSGRIHAVGSSVTGYAPGDPVVAVAQNALASYVVTRADNVMPLTRNITFEEAAGIPCVFLTADYALKNIGHLMRGERVLIHAATGGVGLAAVQIAQQIGADIFATAGSDEKREYLRSLGVEYVFDSRSLKFVEEIQSATNHEGVDLVLNSLSGEFIPASLSLLRSYGRFIEIGKRDIYEDMKVGLYPFRNNLTYSALDLGKMIEDGHPDFSTLFDDVMQRFATGALQPIHTHVIPIEDISSGFELMAKARHMGKIVFSIRKDQEPWWGAKRDFHEEFHFGVGLKAGSEAFRRMLACDSLPPCVLAVGGKWTEAEDGQARPRIAGIARKVRPDLDIEYFPAEDETQESLVSIWQKMLGLSPVGVDDDFFDLGGDSITAIQIQYATNDQFDVQLPSSVLFDFPTIRSFAGLLETERA